MNVRFVYKVLFYKNNTFWEDSVIFHTKVVLQKKYDILIVIIYNEKKVF